MTSRWVLGLSIVCVLSWFAPRAYACGGFFCQAVPVVQTAEEILYVTDDDGALTMTVRINYSGAADEFAWILPVPSAPTLSLGTVDVFDALRNATEPAFTMRFRVEGSCAPSPRCEYPRVLEAGASSSDAAAADASGPGVLIQGELGPFETVVIGDTTAAGVYDWLTANGYDLAPAATPILDEYVAQGSLFVALRLRNDATVDAIQPVTLRWDTPTNPCLPIRLTRIATAAQLPIVTYFLGSTRATPRNYSLIEDFEDPVLYANALPPFSVLNYRSWASREIDLLGGHAFVADFAGATPFLTLTSPAVDDLRTATPTELVMALAERGYEGAAAADRLLRRHLVPPEGQTFNEYRGCLRYASGCGEPTSYDPAGFVDAMNETVIAPRAAAQGWLDAHRYLTRLYTELSGPEMTLDPEFVYDAGLPRLNNRHNATTVTECSGGYFIDEAPAHIEYDSGGRDVVREGTIANAADYCMRRGGWVPGTASAPTGGGCAATRSTAPHGLLPLTLLALLALRRRR